MCVCVEHMTVTIREDLNHLWTRRLMLTWLMTLTWQCHHTRHHWRHHRRHHRGHHRGHCLLTPCHLDSHHLTIRCQSQQSCTVFSHRSIMCSHYHAICSLTHGHLAHNLTALPMILVCDNSGRYSLASDSQPNIGYLSLYFITLHCTVVRKAEKFSVFCEWLKL